MADKENFPTDGVEIAEGISNLAAETVADLFEEEAPHEETPPEETPPKKNASYEEPLPPDDINVEDEPEEVVEEDVEEEIPADMPEAGKAALIKMRQKLKEMKSKIESGGKVTDDAYQKLLKERDLLRDQLGSSGLQETSEFRETYLRPMHDYAQKLVSIAADYGIEKEVLQSAITLNKSDQIRLIRESALANGDFAVTELLPIFASMVEQQSVIKSALADSDATAEKLKSLSSDKVVSLTGEVLDNSLIRLKDAEGHFLLTDSKSNPDWKPKIVNAAKRVISGDVSDQELVDNAIKSQLADGYKALYVKLYNEHQQLLGKNKKVSKLKPNLAGGSKTVSNKTSEKKAMSLSDLADAAVYGD